VYEDIATEISSKIKALKCYKTEIEKHPHPRSIAAIESMATYRGIESGVKRAESFILIKRINF